MNKNSFQLERYFKGVSNHNRISILLLIYENNGITVEAISEKLQIEFKNVSAHIQKLVNAGLVNKRYQGRQVTHTLSSYGNKFIKFIKTF